MHAVDQITGGSLLALIGGLIVFIAIAYWMFRPKKKRSEVFGNHFSDNCSIG